MTQKQTAEPDGSGLSFESLLMSLRTAYIVFDATDPECQILEENQAHADMAMVKREEVIGKKLLDAFPDTSEKYKSTGQSDLVASIRKVATSGETDVMPVIRYDLKNHAGKIETKYWEVSHSPIVENGNVVAVVQETRDITDRVMAKKDLQAAQVRLEQTLSYSSVGTWLWDIPTNTIQADKNSTRMLGLGTGDAPYEGPLEDFIASIHPDDVTRVEAEIARAVDAGSAYECEYRTRGIDGSEYWLLARGRVEVDEEGHAASFPGLIVDITDRKQAEQHLHVLAEANTQFPASMGYRQTLESIASIIVPEVADWCAIDLLEDDEIRQVTVAHKDPEKVKWAKQLNEEFGPVDRNAPNGVPWVIRTGEIEHIPEITDEMLEAAAKTKEQLKLLRGVGMTSAITVPLKIDGNTIGAISFISTDPNHLYGSDDVDVVKGLANRVSLAVYNANLFQEANQEIEERKVLQVKLEELNSVLESRVQERTKLLEQTNAGLKREIKRRRAAEADLSEYSAELSRSNQELQDFAYVASHDLQEPLRKIRAFGDILQSEYGESLGDGYDYLVRMQGAAARMSTLIQDLLAFSRISTREQVTRRIDLGEVASDVILDLEWRIEELDGTVTIGDLPVIQADETHMRQLFQNLIGNALKFHRPDVPPVISVKMCQEEDDGMYTICVEDNGIGFDERYLDRIFSVFQRLHGKDEYDGTGIGLAVVRKITERYGGTITATSRKNIGSTFKVSFPKALEEKA